MCLSTSCIHLVSYVGFPPLASPQLLAFMLFQYPNFSCAPVPLSNFLHAFGFNIGFPSLNSFLRSSGFEYLTFPPCASHQTSLTSCIHWASISILSRECSAHLLVTHWVSHLLRILPSSSQFLLFTPLCPHLGAFTWLQYLNFPPLCLSPISCIHSLGLKTSPLASLNNFLHSSQLGFSV